MTRPVFLRRTEVRGEPATAIAVVVIGALLSAGLLHLALRWAACP